ncbi:hypothetical protein KDA_18170 [Dictyobacter alpinus]|uniref:Uncharacterized protein n=1 Tax=Dictyobacter alpinus TaxID=2014873 RepID=A0A402B4Q3_9CHLR|nr:hypothetical protein [Dictyobacter alpinus]GCE26333.1 hypothetical protein KDA_18170 [Dictyobacter alpinus]
MDWLTRNIQTILSIISAFGTMLSAIVASIALKQVSLSRKQLQLMTDATYDAQKPLLVITPGLRTMAPGGKIDTETKAQFVELKNVGTGVATNIVGAMFLCGSSGNHKYFTSRFSDPLMQGEKNERVGLALSEDVVRLDGRQKVDNHYTLYAPEDAVMRVTVTYHDIFGRKHASICDFFTQWESRSVAFLSNIEHDLEDLRLVSSNVGKKRSKGLLLSRFSS